MHTECIVALESIQTLVEKFSMNDSACYLGLYWQKFENISKTSYIFLIFLETMLIFTEHL